MWDRNAWGVNVWGDNTWDEMGRGGNAIIGITDITTIDVIS